MEDIFKTINNKIAEYESKGIDIITLIKFLNLNKSNFNKFIDNIYKRNDSVDKEILIDIVKDVLRDKYAYKIDIKQNL